MAVMNGCDPTLSLTVLHRVLTGCLGIVHRSFIKPWLSISGEMPFSVGLHLVMTPVFSSSRMGAIYLFFFLVTESC